MAFAPRLIELVLRECNSLLIESLSPSPISDYLWSRNTIHTRDRDLIKAGRGRINQTGELLDILITKDDSALDELINYLKDDGTQSYLIAALEGCIAKHGGRKEAKREGEGSEKPVQHNLTPAQIRRVKECVVNQGNQNILEEWRGIAELHFVVRAADIYSIDRKIKTGDMGGVIVDSLLLWTERSKRGEATFDRLLQILRSQQFNALANSLEDQRENIEKT